MEVVDKTWIDCMRGETIALTLGLGGYQSSTILQGNVLASFQAIVSSSISLLALSTIALDARNAYEFSLHFVFFFQKMLFSLNVILFSFFFHPNETTSYPSLFFSLFFLFYFLVSPCVAIYNRDLLLPLKFIFTFISITP